MVLAASFSKLNVERYLTLGDLDNDYNASDEFGRTQIWARGVQLFLEDPLTGVGVRQFSKGIGDMRMKEGKVIPEWQAPHNSYVEALTETGLFGIVAFFGLIVTCLGTLNALRLHPERLGENPPDPMAGILLVGFMAELVGAVFLSQAYLSLFAVLHAVFCRIGLAPSDCGAPTRNRLFVQAVACLDDRSHSRRADCHEHQLRRH